jgi:transposase InsO family protein
VSREASRTGARVAHACEHVEPKRDLETHEHPDTADYDRDGDDREHCVEVLLTARARRQQPASTHTDRVPHQLARDLHDVICDLLSSPLSPRERGCLRAE